MIFCETALRTGPIRAYSYPPANPSIVTIKSPGIHNRAGSCTVCQGLSEIKGYAGDEGAEGASRSNIGRIVQTDDRAGQCNQECERNQKPNELRIAG